LIDVLVLRCNNKLTSLAVTKKQYIAPYIMEMFLYPRSRSRSCYMHGCCSCAFCSKFNSGM